LPDRNVNAERQHCALGRQYLPRMHLPACFSHICVPIVTMRPSFGGRNELCRADQAPIRVLPANEHFHAVELGPVDSGPRIHLRPQCCELTFLHGLVKQFEAHAAIVLGVIHSSMRLSRFPGHTPSAGEVPATRYNGEKRTPILQRRV
jgi:hypothetical protein